MDCLFKDQLVVLSYMTVRYCRIAFTVFTVFILLNCVPCIEVSCLFDTNGGNVISSAYTPGGYSLDHPIVIERLCVQFPIFIRQGSLLYFAGYVAKEATIVVTKTSALHRPLTSDRALHSDVHAFLHHAVISS
jgi:hypothetical protein